jgi:transcriptional regulator with XRE-family HTH domain
MLCQQQFVTHGDALVVTPVNTDTTGGQLKMARIVAGITLTSVARAVGVSIGHLSRIESDERTASPELIESIRAAIGADTTPPTSASSSAAVGGASS